MHFDELQHIIDVKKIIHKIYSEKQKLKAFLDADGFVKRINSSFESLNSVVRDYDGQENIDALYTNLTSEYLVANYYTEMNTEKGESDDLIICSYNLETLFWDFKQNQIYFFDKFHSDGEKKEGVDFFTPDKETMRTNYGMTKYYLENGSPAVFGKEWSFNCNNYDEMMNNSIVDLINTIVDKMSIRICDSAPKIVEEINLIKK